MKNICILVLCAFFCAHSITIIAQSQDKMIKVKVKSKTGDQDVQLKTEGDTKVIFIDEDKGEVEFSAADFMSVEAGDDKGDKEVTVDVESKIVSGEERRVVTVTIAEKDAKEVIKWEDDGKTIPDNIQAQLKNAGVDVNILGGDADSQSKNVSVNVQSEEEDGTEKRKVSVTITQGDMEKIIDWEDNGEIPADIKSKLEKEGVDVNAISGNDQGETEEIIEIEEKVSDKKMNPKTVIVKKRVGTGTVELGKDGTKNVIQWNGDGELPEEVRKALEEDGISIEDLMSTDGEGKSVRVKMMSDKDIDMQEWDGKSELPDHVKKILEEEGVNIDEYKNADGKTIEKIWINKSQGEDGDIKVEETMYQVKYMDENGVEKTLNWNGEGEMPAEMKKIMDEHKLLKKGK